jgi:fucose 4-O-acetylase-like acetyltransferase
MPLFFWISGYVFGIKKQPPFVEFVRKRVKSLLVPYVLFFIILYAYMTFYVLAKTRTLDPMPFNEWNFITPLWAFFWSSSDTLMRVLMPLWFLTCLFVIEAAFYWIARVFTRQYQLLLLFAASAAICYFISSPTSVFKIPVFAGLGTSRLPWGTDVAFTALVFYGMGYLVRINEHWLVPKSLRAKVIVMVAAIAIGFLFSSLNGWINFPTMRFRNHLLFYAAAFSGISGYVLLCQLIPPWRFLQFLGKNTLTIMAFNFVALDILRTLVTRVGKITLSSTDQSVLWGIVYAAGCALVTVPFIYLINNYFPFILGKRKQKLTAVGAA